MIQWFIIPTNVNYVEHHQTETILSTWQSIDGPKHDIPVVAILTDSLCLQYKRLVVVYKDMMQQQGGSGCCYNPARKTFIYNEDPMDNSIMPKHMSKWTVYSINKILALCVSVKHQVIRDVMKIEDVPMFYSNYSLYLSGMYGLLLGYLDLVGRGIMFPKDIMVTRQPRFDTRKLLTY